MPYTQTFGFSRASSVVGGNALSPLNDNGRRTIMEDPVEKEIPAFAIPEVDIDPNSDEDIITANNEIAEIENAKSVPTIGGPEWEKKQKEVFEKDSGWTQLGTLLSNPFQGMSAFMQQWRRGAQGLIGNEYADAGTGSSLTNLRRSIKAKKRGANVHIPGGILNSASQWIPPVVLGSSLHTAATGTGEIAGGNASKGSKTIAGGLYAYIPGLKQIKGKGTWFSGSPQIQNFLNKGVESISKSKFGSKIWNLMDKGGTYSYKLDKAIEQSS